MVSEVFTSFHAGVTTSAKLFCDNKSATYIATNLVFYECTEINCHTVREQVKTGFLLLNMWISSTKHLHIGMYFKSLYSTC